MKPAFERALYDSLTRRVSEILHYVWDPIGVSGIAQARDEYDDYVPQVVKLILEERTQEVIAHYLYQVEGERMGLTVGSRPSDHVEEVAEMLLAHYAVLRENA